MKKKIFIFSHAMEIGGAERALLGLLTSFDYSKYDVDLFDEKHKAKVREEQFPKDMQAAFNMGCRIVNIEKESQ